MTRTISLPLSLCVGLAGLGWTSASYGQNVVVADALFDRGVAEMQAGQFETGCPALEESHRIDPRPGTMYAIAECYAKWGRIATAVAQYKDYLRLCATLSPDRKRAHKSRMANAGKQVAVLSPEVPTLTITLAAEVPKPFKVQRDGLELGAPLFGVLLPIDPGDHILLFEVSGYEASEIRFSISKGEKKSVELPSTPLVAKKSEPLPEPPKPEPAQTDIRIIPPQPTQISPEVQPLPATNNGPNVHTVGYALGGVGLVGLGVGAVTGLLVFKQKKTIEANCNDIDCSKEGKSAADAAQVLGGISTVAFAVGAVSFVSGAVLLFTRSSSKPSPSAKKIPVAIDLCVTPGAGVTVQLKGVW